MLSEELEYLSNKDVQMANPGFKLNDLYYNKYEETVSLVEATFTEGRVIQALGSFQFGSQSQIQVPIGSFIGSTYLYLELPIIPANVTLARGWALGMISSISFLWGNSSSSQITYNKHTILEMLLAQCETAEKASEMFRLAGNEYLQPPPAGQRITAQVLLPIPPSNLSAYNPKKPFDTTMLSNVITLSVQFDNANAVFGGSGVYPSAFTNASIIYRTGDLSNKALSISNRMRLEPSLRYAYNFQYAQSYTSQSFQGSSTLGQPVTLQVTNFLNADLTGTYFAVLANSSALPGNNNSPSPFNYAPITNISLQLNGQIIYQLPYEMYKLVNMQGTFGGTYFWNSVIAPGTVAPFSSAPVDTYIIMIDWSRLRANMYNSLMQNTWRISANTINISFNTPDTSLYTMYLTNFYNSVMEIGNGETRIYLS